MQGLVQVYNLLVLVFLFAFSLSFLLESQPLEALAFQMDPINITRGNRKVNRINQLYDGKILTSNSPKNCAIPVYGSLR